MSRSLPKYESISPIRWVGWLLACCLLAGCGAAMPPEQVEAMARIRDLGGKVNFKNGGYEVDLSGTGVEDADLACLKQIPNLHNLDLKGTRITDKGLDHIRGLQTIEFLYLERTTTTPEAVDELKKSLTKAEVHH